MTQIGELEVWWASQKHGQERRMDRYPVANVDEAATKIKELTAQDLADDTIDWNAGGLEVFGEFGNNGEKPGWEEFYDELGRNIDEIIEDRAKKERG